MTTSRPAGNLSRGGRADTKNVAIVGASGFAREVLWLIRDLNAASGSGPFLDVLGFVTNEEELVGGSLCDLPILGPDEWFLDNPGTDAVCAIGDPRRRIKVTSWLGERGVRFLTVVHPSVKMSEYVTIGEGCVVCAGVIATTQVTIGNHAHVNLNVTIGHDAVVEDYVTIAPGVNISGNVRVEYGADVGTGSAVIQSLTVGRGAVVGAGAVVSRDIPANSVSMGVPARPARFLDEQL